MTLALDPFELYTGIRNSTRIMKLTLLIMIYNGDFFGHCYTLYYLAALHFATLCLRDHRSGSYLRTQWGKKKTEK